MVLLSCCPQFLDARFDVAVVGVAVVVDEFVVDVVVDDFVVDVVVDDFVVDVGSLIVAVVAGLFLNDTSVT